MYHVNKKDRCLQGRKKQSEIKELLISAINCYFNHNQKISMQNLADYWLFLDTNKPTDENSS